LSKDSSDDKDAAKPKGAPDSRPFERLKELARRVLSVPKAAIDRKPRKRNGR
jgi:hypothetical protein